jgi:hypothetical protein
MTYGSVYEITNPLTSVAKQHFVEWFSGKQLDTKWRLQDINGGTSGAMNSKWWSTDFGGYQVSFTTAANAWGGITYNNAVRPFDLQDNTTIWTAKRTFGSAAGGFKCGTSNTCNTTENNTVTWSSNTTASPNGYFFIWTKVEAEGWGQVKVESDVIIDDYWHTGKLESKPSGINFTLDGVLKATHGTGQGSVKAQPFATGTGSGTESGRSFNVRYCEAWNT